MFVIILGLTIVYLCKYALQGKIANLFLIFADDRISFQIKKFLVLNILFMTTCFILAWQTDPGYLEKSKNLDFTKVVEIFDPNDLCA